MIVTDIFSAMQAGKELANATTWKNAQARTAKLTALLGGAVAIAGLLGYRVPLTADQISLLVSAIGVLYGLFMWIATLVSTTRIGLPPRSDALPSGGPDGSGHPAAEGSERPDPGADDPLPYLNDMENRG